MKFVGIILFIYVAKEHQQVLTKVLYEVGSTSNIIQSLIDVLGFKHVIQTYMGNCENEREGGSSIRKENAMEGQDVEGFSKHDLGAIHN